MKLSIYNIKKGIRFFKNYGFKEFLVRLKEKSVPEEITYVDWCKSHQVSEKELEQQKKDANRWVGIAPTISILIPLYNTPLQFLEELIASIQAQTYSNYELVCVDASEEANKTLEEYLLGAVKQALQDKLIYKRIPNRGIADNTNEALALANGEYIALLDHDDLLTPNALYEMARCLICQEEITQSGVHWNEDSSIVPDVIYSDEDKIISETGEYYAPHFKPDFSIDLLRSNNYITHFLMVKKSLAFEVGGFDSGFDGAQDYDFILRCVEKAKRILHVPKVLYHWRMHEASTASNQESKSYAFDAGAKAIEAHLKRNGIKGEVLSTPYAGFYRVKYELETKPLVSIIIPNKDEADSLKKCIESIERSTYKNYEVIVVENNSAKEETFAYYEQLEQKQYTCKVVTWKSQDDTKPFNYSAINNFGRQAASGEYLVLLNNDIEILSEDWLEEMLSVCQRNEVGVVGANLFYPDDTVQHAGIVVGMGGHARGIADNMFVGLRKSKEGGYLHKASLMLNYSAVTAACLMIKTNVYDEVGGFEEALTVAFNDVDLCLKVRKAGYLVVYDGYVKAYHYESKSRGKEDTEEKVRRFQSEIEYMRVHWNDILRQGDPYYNPNLSLLKNDYSLGL